MELLVTLPDNLIERLKTVTCEPIVYCIRSDITVDGAYSDDVFVGATKDCLFVFSNGDEQFFEIASLESVRIRKQIDNGLLTVTQNGEERIVARYTLKHAVRFACLAEGVINFVEKKFDRVVKCKEREKQCPKCGRMLRGVGKCPKCDKQSGSFHKMLSVCAPYKWLVVVIVSIMMIMTALSLGQQFVVRWFVDGFLSKGKGTVSDIGLFLLLYVGITMLNMGGQLLKNFLCTKLGLKISHGLRANLSAHLQKMSLGIMGKRSEGELMQRVFNDTGHISRFFTNSFCNVFSQAVTIVSLTVLMLILNWKLALAALFFAPFIIIFSRTFWPHMRKMNHRLHRKSDTIQNKLQDVLSGIRIVKTYGREASEIEAFDNINDDYAVIQYRNEKFYTTVFPFMSLLLSFGTYIIVYLGGLDVLNGEMTVGGLTQFVSYAGMLLGPLGQMSFLPRHIVFMTTSLDRIYDVLDEESDVKISDNPIRREIDGNVSIKGLKFGYRPHEVVLDGVDLEVKKGEMIGLVGASGTGKSTLINLIMRLYDVDEGKIEIDGINIKEYDPADYHRQIGVVLQETFLFAGTVLDNIRFANPDAKLEDVIKAAKVANAHEFICRLPDGYNTYIGEKGHNLSGGEKQRIAIARAVLGDPKILILDEATSALDTESEYQIQQALERLRQGRTTFAIAHRLSTLRCADRLAVIDDHKIAELGSHNELLERKGIYHGLVTAQLEMSGKRLEE